MVAMNIFRILGDVSHASSKLILIISIYRNSSAEGVSLITQAFYCLVFLSRYLDFFSGFSYSIWNTTFKAYYILTSLYVLFLMLRVYARTREREKAWKLGGACLGASIVLSPLVMMIFRKRKDALYGWSLVELSWTFSIILESLCILPQLLLLRQTTVPTVLDSYYLLTLGSYRAFYILNWIVREFDTNARKPDAISIIFGVIQTAFYLDFAWVYYSRQRVKLRGGGLVDSDDLRKGWLLSRVLGNRHVASTSSHDDADDEESAPALGSHPNGNSRPGTKWGTRGISVQADDGIMEHERERERQESGIIDTSLEADGDAQLRDPDDLMLDSDDDDATLPGAGTGAVVEGVRDGSEWRDGAGDVK